MTNTVTIDEKNVATIDITIDSAIAKQTYEKTLKAYGANVNIAGFQKGKVPSSIVEKYVGVERIKAEVVDRLFPAEFQKTISENNLNIAYHPSIESLDFEVGSDIKLKAVVELKPEVKLGAVKDVEVEFEEFKNEENALENELEQTRRRFSTLETVDKTATAEDTVVIDFDGYVGEEKIEHGDAKNYTLDLAHSNFIPGFAEQIVGHKAGEEFTINVKFPEEYHEAKLKGADAQFKINLHEVKERKLPELNDELAKKAGKDTLDLLKEDIQNYLTNFENSRNQQAKSEAIFNKVLETTEVKIQNSMIDREYQVIFNEAKNSAAQHGQEFEKLVEAEGGMEAVESKFREEAEKRIKNSLVVEQIAKEYDIKLEQKDIMEHINQMAGMYGMSPVQLFEQLRKDPNSISFITQQATTVKVNQFLIDNNKFVAKNK